MLGSGSKVCVRKGRPADALALSQVFRESWLFAYRGIIPHAHLEGYIRQHTPEWWRNAIRSSEGPLVLDLDGKVVGYATFGAARHRGPYQGEIYELYLDPVYQGLGFGEHLFEGCRHVLDMRKAKGLIVWALLDLSDRILVLSAGEKIAEGPPAAVAADPAVVDAYLGTADHAGQAHG